MGDWLETLALMGTYGKYFSAAELQKIFGNWKRIEADWTVVRDLVRAAMDRGLPPQDPEVQRLAYRWMGLMLHWMDGDMALLDRWGHMFRTEPGTQGRNHAPSGDMIAYIESAIQLRVALLTRYIDLPDLYRLGHVPYTDWAALDAQVQALVARQVPPGSAEARAACRRWSEPAGHSDMPGPGIAARAAHGGGQRAPAARGHPLSEVARAYLESAQAFAQQAPGPA